MNKKGIFISWESHRRSQTLAKEIGVHLIELVIDYHRIIRYPALMIRTLKVIKEESPDFIITMNPSAILSAFTVILCKMIRKTVIVDIHNIGIHFEHPNMLIKVIGQFLNDLIIKNATISLVTNENLAQYVRILRGVPFIIPDPLPQFASYKNLILKGKKNVFFICTFSPDEPYKELLTASEYIDKDIFIYVSGNYDSKQFPEYLPSNIILTGYIPESEYISYLYSSDLIIDLTYREDCLVCGAYEAVSAEKPMVLSDKLALRNYFGDAALYTDNTPKNISSKIEKAITELSLLAKNVKSLKRKLEREWISRKENFENEINMLT